MKGCLFETYFSSIKIYRKLIPSEDDRGEDTYDVLNVLEIDGKHFIKSTSCEHSFRVIKSYAEIYMVLIVVVHQPPGLNTLHSTHYKNFNLL